MTAIALNLSRRTENLLSRINLQAVKAEPSIATTKVGDLNACECGGILAQLNHSRHRHVIMIIGGIATTSTYQRLAWEVAGELMIFGWYQALDFNDIDQMAKLSQIINFAICQLGGQTAKATYKANAIGISASAYSQTWRKREDDIYGLLIQWAHDADYQLNRFLK